MWFMTSHRFTGFLVQDLRWSKGRCYVMNPLGATTADKTETWGQLDLHQKHLKIDAWKMILLFGEGFLPGANC